MVMFHSYVSYYQKVSLGEQFSWTSSRHTAQPWRSSHRCGRTAWCPFATLGVQWNLVWHLLRWGKRLLTCMNIYIYIYVCVCMYIHIYIYSDCGKESWCLFSCAMVKIIVGGLLSTPSTWNDAKKSFSCRNKFTFSHPKATEWLIDVDTIFPLHLSCEKYRQSLKLIPGLYYPVQPSQPSTRWA